ncbi:MAG: alpha/beta hydrolase [Oscillospiraceae bacterium]|nr:alpha/beta hydrolase [Oscillospiraceae bacterium]
MTEKPFFIDHIPALLYGEPSQKVYLFVHGQCGCKEEGVAFAEIACPAGYQVLAIDLPEHGARKREKNRFNPWTAVAELQTVMGFMKSRWSEINLRANSIGAHFSMLAFAGEDICKALFVSPIVNMERLIADMMGWAGVTEQALWEKGEIATNFGQTLSWRYLTWERAHPVQNWRCPTAILYAGQDNMTSRETVEQFVGTHGAALTVMENGEHWFHTPEQLAVLQAWEKSELEAAKGENPHGV